MKQTLYIIYNDQTEYIAKSLGDTLLADKIYYSQDRKLTEDILNNMADNCLTSYFYVVDMGIEPIFRNFSFSYMPEEWDSGYVHIWNNDRSVRLFNKDKVKSNPQGFTDDALEAGLVPLKSINEKIYTLPLFDIIFLSYDESYADENYAKLKNRFPRAKRLDKISGIYNAHRAAAELAKSSKSGMFFVVDADAIICPTFNFDYMPGAYEGQTVHVWYSRNPVNDLEYGYGGIKLFPTQVLLDYKGSPVDFTTSVSKDFKVIPEVSNITKFNTDPFSAWRSGFRECAKLASRIVDNQVDAETAHRLEVWCSKGEDREFGDFTIMGANEGREFGNAHKNQPDMLGLINDFSWLEKRFSS